MPTDSQPPGENTAMREPTWKEMNQDQKLDTLRARFNQLQIQVNTIGRMVEQLAGHKHLPSGEIVTVLDTQLVPQYSPFVDGRQKI